MFSFYTVQKYIDKAKLKADFNLKINVSQTGVVMSSFTKNRITSDQSCEGRYRKNWFSLSDAISTILLLSRLRVQLSRLPLEKDHSKPTINVYQERINPDNY
jgi:hypothetical protein